MTTREIAAQTRNTAAFINADPTRVVLTPVKRERTPAGGYRLIDQPVRPPQIFKLIPQSGYAGAPLITTRDGVQRRVDWVVLGLPDAQMAIGDHWQTPDLREWVIEDVVESNRYETRGLAVERGQ